MSCFDFSCIFATHCQIARTARRTVAYSLRSVWMRAGPDMRKLSCGDDDFGLRRSPRNGNSGGTHLTGQQKLRVWRDALKRLCPPDRSSLGSMHSSIGLRPGALIPRVALYYYLAP